MKSISSNNWKKNYQNNRKRNIKKKRLIMNKQKILKAINPRKKR